MSTITSTSRRGEASQTTNNNSSTTSTPDLLSPADARRESSDCGRKSSEASAEEARSRSRSWNEHRLTEEERMRRKNSVTNVPVKHQQIKEKLFTNKMTPSFLE